MTKYQYVIIFTSYLDGLEQMSTRTFTSKVKAETEVRQLKACGHTNVRYLRQALRD